MSLLEAIHSSHVFSSLMIDYGAEFTETEVKTYESMGVLLSKNDTKFSPVLKLLWRRNLSWMRARAYLLLSGLRDEEIDLLIEERSSLWKSMICSEGIMSCEIPSCLVKTLSVICSSFVADLRSKMNLMLLEAMELNQAAKDCVAEISHQARNMTLCIAPFGEIMDFNEETKVFESRVIVQDWNQKIVSWRSSLTGEVVETLCHKSAMEIRQSRLDNSIEDLLLRGEKILAEFRIIYGLVHVSSESGGAVLDGVKASSVLPELERILARVFKLAALSCSTRLLIQRPRIESLRRNVELLRKQAQFTMDFQLRYNEHQIAASEQESVASITRLMSEYGL